MYQDLHELYEAWVAETGRTTVGDFADWVFAKTNVPLTEILGFEEEAQLLAWFDGLEGTFEGLCSGP